MKTNKNQTKTTKTSTTAGTADITGKDVGGMIGAGLESIAGITQAATQAA
jgi:hypothetical protein